MAQKVDITLTSGKTFEQAYFYAGEYPAYRPITAIAGTAPLRLTVPAHGLPGDTWPVRIESAKSPIELNFSAYKFVQIIDQDTLELPGINASEWRAYSSGGLLVYKPPIDTTGWQARGQIRDKIGGTLLFSWHSDPDEQPDGLIIIEHSRFTLTASPQKTAALLNTKIKTAVYDFEAITPGGDVLAIVSSSTVKIEADVTAWPS